MHRGFRYRLYPTGAQAEQFVQFAGVCRLIYNAALEQRNVWWRQYRQATGHHISFPSQCRELTALRAEFAWMRTVSRDSQDQALRDLDTAFRRFFNGHAEYPKPHRKGVNDSFCVKDVATRPLNAKWSITKIPNIGWVKFRDTRARSGRACHATVSRSGGHWFIGFAMEVEHEVRTNNLPSVGIDRGVASTLTLSTGEMLSVPKSLATIERRQRRAKRVLSRKVRGSTRYARQRRRVSTMASRCARIRKDWQHRVTTDIARRFGAVTIEDLNTKGMTAAGKHKRGLNRSILNQGWGRIEAMLAYKLEASGGTLIKVNPAYTSQTCSECGAIDKANRESQAVFICKHCGHEAHADVNAAINILRGSTPYQRVEASEYRADETRTKSNHAVQSRVRMLKSDRIKQTQLAGAK